MLANVLKNPEYTIGRHLCELLMENLIGELSGSVPADDIDVKIIRSFSMSHTISRVRRYVSGFTLIRFPRLRRRWRFERVTQPENSRSSLRRRSDAFNLLTLFRVCCESRFLNIQFKECYKLRLWPILFLFVYWLRGNKALSKFRRCCLIITEKN